MYCKIKNTFLLLQLLLCFEGIFCDKVTTWRQVFINESSYEESSIKSSVPMFSDVTCSILATKNESNNLFCYDKGVCRLSNLVVENKTLQAEGQDLDCRTKITKCPGLSKRIGTKCYIIGVARRNLNGAIQYCSDQGGFLAEPDVTSEALVALVDGIALQFSAELQTIVMRTLYNTRFLWLGIREQAAVANFKYMKSGTILSANNPLILDKGNTRESLALIATGTTLKYKLGSIDDPFGSMRSSLCEIN